MPDVPNISPASGLAPKSKYFEEAGDVCINMDGCIEVCRTTDTPQARTMYRAYRKRLALNPQGVLSNEKHREQAFIDAMNDLGFVTKFKPIGGSF